MTATAEIFERLRSELDDAGQLVAVGRTITDWFEKLESLARRRVVDHDVTGHPVECVACHASASEYTEVIHRPSLCSCLTDETAQRCPERVHSPLCPRCALPYRELVVAWRAA